MIQTTRSHWMVCEGSEIKTVPTKKLYHEIMLIAGTDFIFQTHFSDALDRLTRLTGVRLVQRN